MWKKVKCLNSYFYLSDSLSVITKWKVVHMASGSLNSVLKGFSLYKFSIAQITKIYNTDVNN